VEMGIRYKRWLTRGDVKDIEEIPQCHGAVIAEGMNYIAVYKNENSQCKYFKAICPHLGAIITWNESESTWDCPAHGSRWNKDGHIINGPAKSDLKPTQVKNPQK